MIPGVGNGNHSRNLAWKIPGTEELAGCRPLGSDTTEYACMLSILIVKEVLLFTVCLKYCF